MEQFLKAILQALASILGGGGRSAAPAKPEAPSRMTIQNIEIIKKWEGLYLEAYLCPANVWTIGYGHTKNVTPGMKITEAGAEALLRQDMEWVENAVHSKVKVPLTQNQYDALCSFVFNVGAGAFGRSTMLRKLNAGDYEGAANEFPRWNKAAGKTLRGLTNRRLDEQKLFRG